MAGSATRMAAWVIVPITWPEESHFRSASDLGARRRPPLYCCIVSLLNEMHVIHVQLAEYIERKPASVRQERCDDVTPLTPYEIPLFPL